MRIKLISAKLLGTQKRKIFAARVLNLISGPSSFNLIPKQLNPPQFNNNKSNFSNIQPQWECFPSTSSLEKKPINFVCVRCPVTTITLLYLIKLSLAHGGWIKFQGTAHHPLSLPKFTTSVSSRTRDYTALSTSSTFDTNGVFMCEGKW